MERNIEYLREVLSSIRNTTKPLEGDGGVDILNDTWNEVDLTLAEIEKSQSKEGGSKEIDKIIAAVKKTLVKNFPGAVLTPDPLANDGLIMFSTKKDDYNVIKIE